MKKLEAGKGRTPAIDWICYAVVFSLPFFPRPTILHPTRYLVAAGLAVMIAAFWLWYLTRKSHFIPHRFRYLQLLALVSAVALFYGPRAVMNENADPSTLLGRLLTLVTTFTVAAWILRREIAIQDVYRRFFYGFLLLSVAVIAVGVTGVALLGEVRPPRPFGWGFFKTTGVPKSYGEFGILATAAWAYLLVFKSEQRRFVWYGALVLCFLATLISQSRNVYLAVLLVVGMHFVLRSRIGRRTAPLMLGVALALPMLVFAMLPFFETSAVGKTVIGEEIYRRNVYGRQELLQAGLDVILSRPGDFLFGSDTTRALESVVTKGGEEVGVHNHFLLELLTLGLVPGVLNILIFLIPAIYCARSRLLEKREGAFLYLTALGLISCYQFYAGLFSAVAAVHQGALWAVYCRRGRRALASEPVRLTPVSPDALLEKGG